MKILITGTSGHLGEALVRTLRDKSHEIIGLDVKPGPFTGHVGSIADRAFVHERMSGVEAVLHAATLHKPHVATHTRQDFIDTNITGTSNLLEEAAAAGVKAFVFTSTTSTFGRAMNPAPGAPSVWVDEELRPQPKNIYGVTKVAAEDLCELFHAREKIPCVILKTSRFFPEIDDDADTRRRFDDANVKVNEFLHRRVEIQDVVDAHEVAIERAAAVGFGRYIISATTPFQPDDLEELSRDAPAVLARYVPEYVEEFARRGWSMFPSLDRVYSNERARRELGWKPHYDFARVVALLRANESFLSPLARSIGKKGYHEQEFTDGPFPVAC
ncbi:NAD-dependent epimerase/dehydratase family protein [Usitatibacter palustris]|uniref:GDP-L-fucose synthase n=1 Tax=Usitatibacter palustris TaxID=2732487 RepID=A0A6M4H884_9PROT|nr:NAD(P)-dependent oxidoreductase [Usitatibacter palustris]QJR15365.1 GDP-L-fucose synthase [Usitatibacter palustris]